MACRADLADNVLAYFADAGDKGLFEEPGKVFSYSNNGFGLAGLALATINNTTYTKAIEDYILKPLKMTNSSFNIYDVAYRSFAVGHNIDPNGKPTPTSNEYWSKVTARGRPFQQYSRTYLLLPLAY